MQNSTDDRLLSGIRAFMLSFRPLVYQSEIGRKRNSRSVEHGARESTSKAIFVFQFPRLTGQSMHLLKRLGSFAHGRFLSRGEDHSVHRRHLIANLSHLALPHKLNDRLNGWPCRYAKERFFGYFAKYPVKDSDGPL